MANVPFSQEYQKKLVEALRERRLILVVGAGLSIPYGIPGWKDLIECTLPDDLEEQGEVNAAGIMRAMAGDSSNWLLAAEMWWKKTTPQNRQALFQKLLNSPEIQFIPGCAHELIFKLYPFLKGIVTTNYDTLLERAWPREQAWEIKNQKQSDIGLLLSSSRPFIYHIHGTVDAIEDTVILTNSQYARQEVNEAHKSLFEAMSLGYTLLFIGYGGQDPDLDAIRERLFQRFESAIPNAYIIINNPGELEGLLSSSGFVVHAFDNKKEEDFQPISDLLAFLAGSIETHGDTRGAPFIEVPSIVSTFKERKYHTIDLTVYGTAQDLRLEYEIEKLYITLDTNREDVSPIYEMAKRDFHENVPFEFISYINQCREHVIRRAREHLGKKDELRFFMDVYDKGVYGEKVSKKEISDRLLSVTAGLLLDQVSKIRLEPDDLIRQISREFGIPKEEASVALGYVCKVPLERITLEEAVAKDSRVLLKGAPGSGKTTISRYLVWRSLMVRTDQAAPDEGDLLFGPDGPVPLYVRLEGFRPDGGRPDQDLLAYCCGQWGDLELDAEGLEQLIDKRAIWLVLDGLDEIRGHDSRNAVVKAVGILTKRHPDSRIMVTSRPAALAAGTAGEMGLREYELLDLRVEQRDEYIRKFMDAIYPEASDAAGEKASRLIEAIEENRTALDLATTPLMLTVLATVHKAKGVFPTQRAALYEACIETLIWRRYGAGGPEKRGMDAAGRFEIVSEGTDYPLIKLCVEDVKGILSRIAWEMQTGEAGAKLTVEIAKGELEEYMRSSNVPESSYDLCAAEFLNLAELRLGLLSKKGDEWGFVHRTFQEYLAALRLCSMREKAITQEVISRFPEEADKEMIRLMFGILSEGKREVRETLFDEVVSPSNRTPYGAAMVADCVKDMMEYSESPLKVADKAREWLYGIMKESAIKAKEEKEAKELFLEAADALARIREPGHWDEEMVTIPEGTFRMGSESEEAGSNEAPVHVVGLSAYKIDRYPVTVRRFKEFIDAGGYDKSDLWEEEGWKWKEEKKLGEPDEWERQLKRRYDPVVGVSWYEASAFARWKGRRLPTEAEWERAARGDEDERLYPWGDQEYSPLRANYDEIFGTTSAVGSFPEGRSPCGCYDMAGNVDEWCSDWFEEDYYKESPGNNPKGPEQGEYNVVRGGAWDFYPWWLRVSVRGWYVPDDRDFYLGFRCAQDCK